MAHAVGWVQIIRNAGGVTIADEVQSGFGRTGSAYWGFENQGVQPDIVTMAKGIGNGLPLAAVVTTPEIARSLATRSHLNTFGGNPVCCAGGRAVLQAIDEDRCQENSAEVGVLFLGAVSNRRPHLLWCFPPTSCDRNLPVVNVIISLYSLPSLPTCSGITAEFVVMSVVGQMSCIEHWYISRIQSEM